MKVGCETRAWTLVDRGADGTVGPETQVNYNGNKQSVCLHVRIGVITRKRAIAPARVCGFSGYHHQAAYFFWTEVIRGRTPAQPAFRVLLCASLEP